MRLAWWLIGSLGVTGALIVGAGFVFGWPVIVGTKLGRVGLAIAAGVAAAVAIYGSAKQAGRAEERARLKALTEKEVADAAKERARIDALSDEDVDKELAQWDRK